MKDKLIKLLGGYTLREFELHERECCVFTERAQEEVNFLREQVKLKDNEIHRLTDLMLEKSGFIHPTGVIAHSKHEPIQSRKSWPQVKRDLEANDARISADRVREYWLNKRDSEMQQGNTPNASNGESSSELALDLGTIGLAD